MFHSAYRRDLQDETLSLVLSIENGFKIASDVPAKSW